MKRHIAVAALIAASLALAGRVAGHGFDHPPIFPPPTAPPAPTFISEPAGAWELIATVAAGDPLTDLDFFTLENEIYASVGTLAISPPVSGGQTIIKLTEKGEVTPTSVEFVARHPSAGCLSDPSAALGLQHDAEATPKGKVLFNTRFPRRIKPDTRDAQLVLDATDNEGRCHDQETFGFGADPQGGLEIIDISDLNSTVLPRSVVEIGLTSHIGEAHTVNVDPKRAHIAFAVTSDFVTVACNQDDTECKRRDEDDDPNTNQGLSLDGFELVDLRSCMNFTRLDPVDFRRLMCRPEVYRYRWSDPLIAMGHTVDSLAGCHELEIYPNDLLTCAGVNATILFDLSGAFDDNGTPRDFSDDTPKGTPLPCAVRDSVSPDPYGTGAKVTDCVKGEGDVDLTIEGWKEIGSPSLEGVVHVGTAFHQGRVGNTPPPFPATEDVEISHEAELTGSGKFILATDERGGGVLPPGSSCLPPPGDNIQGNGGIHAYRVDRLLKKTPNSETEAWKSYARTPGGAKAIFRTEIETGPQPDLCTSHVFQQIPGQNRIFMGWYSQGTQVVDFIERPGGRLEFKRAGFFIPANADQWVSHVFKMKDNRDGTFTYWGATGDFNVGTAGRNAMDVWKVTLSAPQQPQ